MRLNDQLGTSWPGRIPNSAQSPSSSPRRHRTSEHTACLTAFKNHRRITERHYRGRRSRGLQLVKVRTRLRSDTQSAAGCAYVATCGSYFCHLCELIIKRNEMNWVENAKRFTPLKIFDLCSRLNLAASCAALAMSIIAHLSTSYCSPPVTESILLPSFSFFFKAWSFIVLLRMIPLPLLVNSVANTKLTVSIALNGYWLLRPIYLPPASCL